MNAPSAYRISEAARQVGVSPSALRQWERQGLVRPMRTSAGYRLYSDDDVSRLHRVRQLREVDGVNPPGIRRVLDGHAGTANGEGRRLREARRRSRLSLRDASERSGLSEGFISALERGATGASVSTMQRLTSAYGTTLLDLLGSDASGGRVVRRDARPALQLDGTVRIEQLSRDATQLEPQLFTLAPDASSDGAYSHQGEELIFVLSGTLTVWVGEHESYQLAEGDSLTFPSTLPHRWRNDASGETRLLWINTPLTF
jgi:DNA-binding transcriptional MerR regulator/quercetin dioxygenase-like cupin family protein